MKFRTHALGILATALIASASASAGDWDNRTVYTKNGIVKFVPDSVSASELSQMLFPASEPMKTRSLFSETSSPVTVAMLINFEFDSADLTGESEELLDVIGTMLNMKEAASHNMLIEGHTDIIGAAEYNLNLSYRRAESVLNYLVEKHDIDSDRLVVSGKGENELIDPTTPKDPINRRVQFKGV